MCLLLVTLQTLAKSFASVCQQTFTKGSQMNSCQQNNLQSLSQYTLANTATCKALHDRSLKTNLSYSTQQTKLTNKTIYIGLMKFLRRRWEPLTKRFLCQQTTCKVFWPLAKGFALLTNNLQKDFMVIYIKPNIQGACICLKTDKQTYGGCTCYLTNLQRCSSDYDIILFHLFAFLCSSAQ